MSVELKRGQALGTLSLTPLIDVVFLLLIFFLVTARFEKEDRELDMPLPTASEAKPLIEDPREIFINIDQTGRYIVQGKTLTSAELATLLDQAAANNPNHQSVIIRADKRVQLDYVVLVMDLCNREGILYSLNTDPGP